VRSSQEVKFSFLTSGPTYRVELPGDSSRLPELSAPLCIRESGFRRSFDFAPIEFDTGPSPDLSVKGAFEGPDGLQAILYSREETPPQWYLRWELNDGALTSHLREEDGPDYGEVVVGNLFIEQGSDGPFLLPSPPLSRGVVPQPGYEESAVFRPTGSSWFATFLRPGYLRQNAVVSKPSKDGTSFRAGLSDDVELQLFVREESESGARKILDQARESFGSGSGGT